ncbi:MAG: Asp23/Gls24 family envelope stress response protein [Chloroflexi bacterium]|nr:Asp23/Gls24 family envelope stress response protein [Chloroflexota bacterium]MCL5273159.1 Asp23/Gls24 family envelope stress response protein [Chloroflexota bacterium]
MSGKVILSPDVMRDVARITTLATPGVLAMASAPARGRKTAVDGVEVEMQESGAHIRLRVIAAVNLPLQKLGEQIQSNVAAAIAEITGMTVTAVDVIFEDVRSKP